MVDKQVYPSKGTPDREPDPEGSTTYTGGPTRAPDWGSLSRSHARVKNAARQANIEHIAASQMPSILSDSQSADVTTQYAKNTKFGSTESDG